MLNHTDPALQIPLCRTLTLFCFWFQTVFYFLIAYGIIPSPQGNWRQTSKAWTSFLLFIFPGPRKSPESFPQGGWGTRLPPNIPRDSQPSWYPHRLGSLNSSQSHLRSLENGLVDLLSVTQGNPGLRKKLALAVHNLGILSVAESFKKNANPWIFLQGKMPQLLAVGRLTGKSKVNHTC